MSYARWGEDGSHVYVIGINTGELIDGGEGTALLCVQCRLQLDESFVAAKPAEMIAHLQAHRERGDTVPERAFERLREECDP